MVSKRVLAFGPDLDRIMMVGGGHHGSDGTEIEESLRADCFEAILIIVYLTYGIDEAKRITHMTVLHGLPSDPSSLPELG